MSTLGKEGRLLRATIVLRDYAARYHHPEEARRLAQLRATYLGHKWKLNNAYITSARHEA